MVIGWCSCKVCICTWKLQHHTNTKRSIIIDCHCWKIMFDNVCTAAILIEKIWSHVMQWTHTHCSHLMFLLPIDTITFSVRNIVMVNFSMLCSLKITPLASNSNWTCSDNPYTCLHFYRVIIQHKTWQCFGTSCIYIA